MASDLALESGELGHNRNLFRDSLLYSYSEIFFVRNRVSGILILLATFIHFPPFLAGGEDLSGFLPGVIGLLSIILANGIAFALNLHRDTVREGFLGYNALLVGIALSNLFVFNNVLVAVIIVSIVSVVFLTAALRNALGYHYNLPVLSLPFLIIVYLVLLASSGIDSLHMVTSWSTHGNFIPWLPDVIECYFRSLGAVFFAPNVVSGFLIFTAILIFSRYSILLTMLGFSLAWFVMGGYLNLDHSAYFYYVAFNFMLVSIAVGGVWFVPQKSSLLLAIVSVLIAGVVLTGSIKLLAPFGLPILILPFNVTMLLVLAAMRQRILDKNPKAVDFASGSPEVNRAFYRTRVERFGSHFIIRFKLPFKGAWVCTQGIDGEHTHKGLWRHAYDFEVSGSTGELFNGIGVEVEQFHCWKLPVLACADGRVVRIVNDVTDNRIGDINTAQNWGNLVIIEHGIGLYSLVCHLAQGSVSVTEGAIVHAGDEIALCGNSGRSPQPHLHFQLQATPRIGAPTIYSEFHEVVSISSKMTLNSVLIPEKGQKIRAIHREDEIARLLHFPPGTRYECEVTRGNSVTGETLESEMDLYGNLKLVSLEKTSVLHFDDRRDLFTIFDYRGRADSALFAVYCCIPRVPLEDSRNLIFSDNLTLRPLTPFWKRWIGDLIPWISAGSGCRITYRSHRIAGALVIKGDAMACGGNRISTKAEFDEQKGPVFFSIEYKDTVMTVRLRQGNA